MPTMTRVDYPLVSIQAIDVASLQNQGFTSFSKIDKHGVEVLYASALEEKKTYVLTSKALMFAKPLLVQVYALRKVHDSCLGSILTVEFDVFADWGVTYRLHIGHRTDCWYSLIKPCVGGYILTPVDEYTYLCGGSPYVFDVRDLINILFDSISSPMAMPVGMEWDL